MTPFTTSAKHWIEQISKKRKLTKNQRHAVMAFAMWMDEVIRQQELQERIQHGKEN